MRWLGRLREVVDDALNVGHGVVHDTRDRAFVLWVVDVETLRNELGVCLVLGEDDRLPDPIPASNRLSMRHQMREDLVDRVLIEEPLVNSLRFDAIWNVAFLVPLQGVPLFLLLFRELVVLDPASLKLQRNGNSARRDEELIFDGVVQRVGVGGNATLKIEQSVCVDVDLILRRGSEADKECVEVVKDGAVLLVDRPVRFVDDD